jgi:Dolichyl-phosphate-mannose-protein mannosyltransferase
MLAIAGAGVLLALVLRPFQPTPFIDDWVYAFPVQQLIESGQLRIPEYANPSLVLMLYGLAWCLPFGFSFITLGISTWTLWIALQLGVYFLVLEIGGPRRNALIGAAVVAVFPTCFALAPTFMSDVPFLAAESWSMLFFVRGLNRRDDRGIWFAALLACAAIGIRMVGLVIPCAMIAVLLAHTGSWGRRWRVLIAPLLCLPFAAAMLLLVDAFSFASADVSYLPNSPQNRIPNLLIALQILPTVFPATLAEALIEAGIAILPAALGSSPRPNARIVWSIVVGVALALLAARFTDWIPFGKGNTWVIGEVWATPGLVSGWTPRFELPASVRLLTTVAAFSSITVVVASFRAWTVREADWFVAWMFLGLALLSALLWLYNNDRYGLIYIPVASSFLLGRAASIRLLPAVSGLAIYAAFSVVSTIDHKAYNQALWSSVERLRSGGVPVAEIDGGYTVNGWLQYVRPEQAHREPDGRITIPLFNDMPAVAYTISNSPLAGREIVDTVSYSGWASSGNLYVLRRGN